MLLVCVVAACGGGSVEGDPLIQSTLMAQFDNRPWVPAFGFGRFEDDRFAIYVGDEKISCADDFMGKPRTGTYAFASVPDAAVADYPGVSFMLLEVSSGGDLNSQFGTGGVMITASTASEVSAVFAFSTTAGSSQFSLTGAVTMLRCP